MNCDVNYDVSDVSINIERAMHYYETHSLNFKPLRRFNLLEAFSCILIICAVQVKFDESVTPRCL